MQKSVLKLPTICWKPLSIFILSLTKSWYQMEVRVFMKRAASCSPHSTVCFHLEKRITESNLYCCNWIFAIRYGLLRLYPRRNNTRFEFSIMESIFCNLRGLKFYLGMHCRQCFHISCNLLKGEKANLGRSF